MSEFATDDRMGVGRVQGTTSALRPQFERRLPFPLSIEREARVSYCLRYHIQVSWFSIRQSSWLLREAMLERLGSSCLRLSKDTLNCCFLLR